MFLEWRPRVTRACIFRKDFLKRPLPLYFGKELGVSLETCVCVCVWMQECVCARRADEFLWATVTWSQPLWRRFRPSVKTALTVCVSVRALTFPIHNPLVAVLGGWKRGESELRGWNFRGLDTSLSSRESQSSPLRSTLLLPWDTSPPQAGVSYPGQPEQRPQVTLGSLRISCSAHVLEPDHSRMEAEGWENVLEWESFVCGWKENTMRSFITINRPCCS